MPTSLSRTTAVGDGRSTARPLTTGKCNISIRSSSEHIKGKGVIHLYTELPNVDIKMSLPVSRNSGRPQMPKHRYYCQYSFRYPLESFRSH